MAILFCEYFSVARKSAQSFNVILPIEAIPQGGGNVTYNSGPYKTIYLLHGYSGSRNDWQRHTDIEKWATMYQYAVIIPDGADSFYINNDDTGVRYGDYIGQELVNISREMFSLSHRREDTVIAGLSMGGFGALINGLKFCDTFGAIIALSPALITEEVAAMKPGTGNMIAPYGYYRNTFGDPSKLLGSDKDPKHLSKHCFEHKETPDIFLACGKEDFLFESNNDFHIYLEKIGYPHVWWVQEGKHDFEFWNKAMPTALERLFNQAY